MKYIVYLTTNTKNNKIYVGVHKTENPLVFDGYIGCGVNIYKPGTYKKSKTPFQHSVNKYGIDCFKRSVLKIFDNLDDALKLEYEIVNETFILRKDTYNVALGGGFIPLTNKITYQYTLDGIFVKEWESKASASRHFEVNESLIGHAIMYNSTSCGFLWGYEKYEKLDISNYTIYNTANTVYRYSDTGELIDLYISITNAANKANTTTSNIQRAIKGSYKINNNYYSLELVDKFNILEKISIKNKQLYMYSPSGEFVKEFSSPKEAVKEFSLKSSSVITTSIRTGRCCAGYQWNLEKVSRMKEIIPIKPKKRKVGQFSKNGELIKEFDSILQSKNEFGSGVQKALDGKIQIFKGFIFKYLEN